MWRSAASRNFSPLHQMIHTIDYPFHIYDYPFRTFDYPKSVDDVIFLQSLFSSPVFVWERPSSFLNTDFYSASHDLRHLYSTCEVDGASGRILIVCDRHSDLSFLILENNQVITTQAIVT